MSSLGRLKTEAELVKELEDYLIKDSGHELYFFIDYIYTYPDSGFEIKIISSTPKGLISEIYKLGGLEGFCFAYIHVRAKGVDEYPCDTFTFRTSLNNL